MARYVTIVDRMSDWRWSTDGLDIRTVDGYLKEPIPRGRRPARVINLCRRYGYMSGGYYCSLLAEARGETPMPTVADILDLSRKSVYDFALPDLERVLHRTMKRLSTPPTQGFQLHVFFGRPCDTRFKKLATEAFDVFRYPLLKMRMEPRGQGKPWKIKWIRPMGLHEVKINESCLFEETLRAYVRAPGRKKREAPSALYDLAILCDPNERMPPSDAVALQRFVKAGRSLRIDVEMIGAKDYHRIPEFDAMFIRETTSLDHHTFRFARKADVEGIPVIDDPGSILRCTNKVFLAEALSARGIPAPYTRALNRTTFDQPQIEELEARLTYPMVLKIPDGSFSRGVVKAENRGQLQEHAAKLFERSRIILAQEYMYTPFDWRIGLIAGEPLFACRYFMSRSHWQIYNHQSDGKVQTGAWDTMPIEAAPGEVVEVARRAAAIMGNGLYGVDLKQNERGVFVIEVNDNPSIESGVEDKVLKGALYERIMAEFIRRIEKARAG